MNQYKAKQTQWLQDYHDNGTEVMSGFTIASPHTRDVEKLFAYQRLDTDLWQLDVAISHVPASVAINSPAYKDASQALYTRKNKDESPVYMLPQNVTEDICALKIGEEKPAFCFRFTIDLDNETLAGTFWQGVCCATENFSYSQFAKNLHNQDMTFLKLSEFIVDRRNCERNTILGDDLPDVFGYSHPITVKTVHHIESSVTQLCNHSIAAYAEENMPDFIYRQAWSQGQDIVRASFSDEPSMHHIGYDPYAHFDCPLSRFPDLANAYMIEAHYNGLPSPYAADDLKAIINRANSCNL